MMKARKRHLRVITALIAGAVVSVPGVASANDFTPLPGAPTVGTVTGPGEIQPGGETPTTYSASATVSSSATLDYLNNVTLCVFKTGSSSECDKGQPDPTTAFVAVWTEPVASGTALEGTSSTDNFAKTGTNEYVLDTTCSGGDTTCSAISWSGSYATATSMTITFKFTVSKAMLKSDTGGWTAQISVLDDRTNAATAGGKGFASSTFKVMYYAEIGTTPDNNVNFGNLAENSSTTTSGENIGGVTYRANAASKYRIVAQDFTYVVGESTVSTISLVAPTDTSDPGNPGTAQVFLSCNEGATHSGGTKSWVTTSASDLVGGGVSASTSEAYSSRNSFSCKLYYGSGATRSLVKHSSNITITIVDAAV